MNKAFWHAPFLLTYQSWLVRFRQCPNADSFLSHVKSMSLLSNPIVPLLTIAMIYNMSIFLIQAGLRLCSFPVDNWTGCKFNGISHRRDCDCSFRSLTYDWPSMAGSQTCHKRLSKKALAFYIVYGLFPFISRFYFLHWSGLTSHFKASLDGWVDIQIFSPIL